jgi:hypothetical protein
MAGQLLSLIRKDLLHPSDLAVFQPHLDPARMEGGGCEDFTSDFRYCSPASFL